MQGGGKKPGLLEDEGEEGEDFIYAQVLSLSLLVNSVS